MKKMYLLSGIIMAVLLAGCGSSNDPGTDTTKKEITRAFFGDKENSRVVVAEVETTRLFSLSPKNARVISNLL